MCQRYRHHAVEPNDTDLKAWKKDVCWRGRWKQNSVYIQKADMEPEDDAFQKESPFPEPDLQFFRVKLQRCVFDGII